MHQQDPPNKMAVEADFFAGCGDGNRYKVLEIVGKGAYGVVCSAIDTVTGEKVAIKKITNIFEHISDATRILREIKFLRLLRHPDIVDIKCIMMPRSRRNFREIYVVFELMDSDLHQVIKANEDLTHEHHRFFLYQMLRALKYMHSANVYHRDVKPKNILANANCKLKLCDFGLARVAFSDTPTTMFWTDYVATRWYRAPELCGSFFSKVMILAVPGLLVPMRANCKHTPAIDIWSIGCIFAEILSGKALFPGKNVLHQLDLITEVLGTPSADIISRVQSEKARTYLTSLRKKQPVDLAEKFPSADPSAIKLLQRLLAFHPQDRPSAEEALADPYFEGLAQIEREPSCQTFSRSEFEFERRKMTKEDIRELIFREILEYHPKVLKDYMQGGCGASFLHPRPGPRRKQFVYLDENTEKCRLAIPPERQTTIASVDNLNTAVEASVSGDPNPDAVAANIPAASWPPPRVPNGKLDPQHENVRSRSDSADEGICSQNTENDSNEAPAEEYNSKQQDISFDGSRVDPNCKEQSSQPAPGEPSQLATSSNNSNRYYSSKSMECAS